MRHKSLSNKRLRSVLTLAVASVVASSTHAANVTWGSSGGSAWLTGSNWSGGTAPLSADIAVFGVNPTGSATGVGINMNFSGNLLTISGILIDSTRSTTAFFIGNSTTVASGTLALSGSTGVLLDNSSAANFTIQDTQGSGTKLMGLSLGSTGTINVSNVAGSITISSIISGVGGFNKTGAGLLTLSATNTFTGKTTISAGTVAIAGETAFGANPGSFTADQITLNGGTIRATSALSFSSNRGITLGSSGGTIDTNTSTVTLNNPIVGTGALTKIGTTTLTAATANITNYTGPTNINAGTISFTANNTLANTVTLTSGAFVSGSTTTWTGTALSIGAGTTLTTTGTVRISAKNTAYFQNITGSGTLLLGNTSSSATSPDITNISSGAANYGVVLGTKIDIGSGNRFFTGTTDRNDVGRYSGDMRFDGIIAGTGTINFVGGTESSNHNMHFVLNAANTATFTGGITINRADLALTNNDSLGGSNPVTFANNNAAYRASLFTFGHNLTIGSLNDTSTAGSSRNIRNGSLVATNGGTNTTGSGVTGSLALGLDANSTLTINQTTNGTFGGIISDGLNDTGLGAAGTYRTLAIAKNGSAALTLSGSSTYTGGTTINNGPIVAGNGTSGVAAIVVSSTTALGTGAVTIAAVNNLRALDFNFGTGTLANAINLPTLTSTRIGIQGNNSASITNLTGKISGGYAGLNFFIDMGNGSSSGIIRLANTTNDFLASAVQADRGVLAITGNGVLGAASNPLILDQGSAAGELRFDASSINLARSVNIATSSKFDIRGDNDGNGVVETSNDATISGNITGSGGTGFIGGTQSAGNSTGSIRLTGTNTFTGGYSVAVDTKLIAGSTTALGGATGLASVASGGTIAFDTVGTYGNNKTISLSGSGVVSSSVGVGALQNIAGNNTFNGPIILAANSSIGVTAGTLNLGGAISGAFNLTKVGTNTLNLTASSTYTGTTNVNTGTLSLTSATINNPISTSSSILVSNGATLDVSTITASGGFIVGTQKLGGSGAISGNATTSANSDIIPGGVATKGTFTVNNNLSLNGGSISYDLDSTQTIGSGVNDLLTVNGTLDLLANTKIALKTQAPLSAGSYVYRLINYNTLGAGTGVFTLDTSALGISRLAYALDTSTPGQVNLNVTGAPFSITWAGNDGINPSFWDVVTTINWNSGIPDQYFDADSVTFDDSASSYTVALQTNVQPGSVTVNNTTNPYTMTAATTTLISSTGSFTKSGSNSLALTNVNLSLLGAFNLNDGVVTGNGTISATAFNVASGSIQQQLIGIGAALTKSTAGTVTLLGSSSYTGATTINAGKLQIGDGTTGTPRLGTGAITINSTGELAYNLAGTAIFTSSTNISGAGTLSLTSPGGVTEGNYFLTGTNSSFTGTVAIKSGARLTATSNTLGTSTVTVDNTGALLLSLATVSNPISIAGTGWNETLGKLGALRLSTSTVTGPITLTADARITAYNSTGTVSGPISGAFKLEIGGSDQANMGTVTLGGSNSYTGGTDLVNATLNITNSNALGTGTLNFVSSPTTGLNTSGAINIANNAAITLTNNIILPAPLAATSYTLSKTTSGISTGTQLNLTGNISGGNSNLTLYLNSNTGSDNTTTYRFAGSNTFAGTVRLNRGGIVVTNENSLGTATISLDGNNNSTLGDLRFENSMTFPNNIVLNQTATDPISTNANTVTLSGSVSSGGASTLGAFIKIGSGTLILTGTNTYTTNTTITSGTLQVGNGGTSGTLGTGPTITDNAAISFNRSDAIASSANIVGSGVLNQVGTGTTTLTGTNTYTGGTNINSGTLQIGNAGTSGSLGTGPVVDNATLIFNRSDSVVLANPISGTGTVSYAGSSTLTFTGTNTYSGPTTINSGTLQVGNAGTIGTLGTGGVVDNAALVLNRTDSVTIANNISGTGTLSHAGTGTTSLTGSSTYSGATSVNAGTLAVNGTHTGGDNYTIAGSAILAGTGTITPAATKTVTVNGTLAPGNSGIGTLNIAGGVFLNGLSSFEIDSSTVTTDKLNAIGNTITAGAGSILNVTDIAGTPNLSAGESFDLFDGSFSGVFATLTLPTLPSPSIVWDTSALYTTGVISIIPSGPASATWAVDADGDWQTAGNWTPATVPTGIGAVATFDSAISADTTVTLTTPTTAGTLNFNNTNKYTIAGTSTLTLQGTTSAAINVTSGNHDITAPLALASNTTVTVGGSNTLKLTQLQPTTVDINKAGTGTMEVNNVTTTGALNIFAGTVKVTPNGTSTGYSKINTLTTTGTGTLDITNNSAIITGTSESDVRTMITSGFNGGDWLGTGITSSNAANDNDGVTAVGYANNNDLGASDYNGVPLGATDTIVKYTYYGDADLSGTVTLEDFTQFLVGYQQGGTPNWINGDFDYSGTVTLEDFSLFLAGYQGPNTPLTPSLALALSADAPHSAPLAESISIVPEPTSLGLLAVGAMGLLRRRRK